MRTFAIIGVGVVALLLATVSRAVSGGVLLALASACAAVSALRSRPQTARHLLAWPEGPGRSVSLAAVCFAFAAAAGNCSWHLERAAFVAEQRRQAQALEDLAASMPALKERVAEAVRAIQGGQLDDARRRLQVLDSRYAPLSASPMATRPEVSEGLTRLADARQLLYSAEETRVVQQARTALASSAKGAERALVLLKARDAMTALGHRSPDAAALADEVATGLTETVARLPVLQLPEALLAVKFPKGLAHRSDTVRVVTGFPGAEALAIVEAQRCTAFYLAATPRGGALTAETVAAFLRTALGPGNEGRALAPPAGKGSRSTSVKVAGTVVHTGWFDQRLVEAWVGDFSP